MMETRQLPSLVNSSGSSVVTAGIGHLDDADCVTIFLSTGTNIVSSNVSIEVSQFDPADGAFDRLTGVVLSSAWYPLLVDFISTVPPTLSSGIGAITIPCTGFRGIRIRTSANSITTGTTIAFAMKQVTV